MCSAVRVHCRSGMPRQMGTFRPCQHGQNRSGYRLTGPGTAIAMQQEVSRKLHWRWNLW